MVISCVYEENMENNADVVTSRPSTLYLLENSLLTDHAIPEAIQCIKLISYPGLISN